jgi:hypothetical protein
MPPGMYPHKPLSEEHKRSIGKALRGFKHSDEAKRNMRLAQQLRIAFGLKVVLPNSGQFKKGDRTRIGAKASEETRERLRVSHLGQKPWCTGKHVKINDALDKWRATYRKDKHYNWKGGISGDERTTKQRRYKEWRDSVFRRDDWTCRGCGVRGIYLEAHHVKAWARYPAFRYQVSNGLSLCRDCHAKTGNYRGRRQMEAELEMLAP